MPPSEWVQRSSEEQALLNPAFTSVLIWHAVTGYQKESGCGMPFVHVFLVLAFVLTKQNREALPSRVQTSLASWAAGDPSTPIRVADAAQKLEYLSREGLQFGMMGQLLEISKGCVSARNVTGVSIPKVTKEASPEVGECCKKAFFVGRWLASSGEPANVFSILGVGLKA